MKIGIEAQRIFRKKKHGMDMVALELIKALQVSNTSHHFLVFAQADEDMQCLQNGNGVEIVLLPNAPYPIWEQWYLPKAAKNHQVDLLHCTSNTAPVFLSVPLVITLHDIIYLEKISLSQGTAYQIFGNIYRKWIVPIIAQKAVKIITVSNFENKRILNYFGFNKNLVQTIYNAAGSNFKRVFDPNLLAETKKKYKLPDSFIFFIGNTDPKKNVIGVLKALSILKKANNLPCKLVMLDIDKNYLQNKANEIGDPSIVEDILFTGYVPNHELPAIYSLATIFLYPSLRESFGIPLVEAMCCEVPVITSNTSSMPEIVGDAALICDPFDENAIAKAINALLNNNDLSQSLSLKGKIQGNYFNWEKNASETLKIYQSIVPNENEF
jgi:glycosyltransferase involved in cell wall biosynthesis